MKNKRPILGMLSGGVVWGAVLFSYIVVQSWMASKGVHPVLILFVLGVSLHWEIERQYLAGYEEGVLDGRE